MFLVVLIAFFSECFSDRSFNVIDLKRDFFQEASKKVTDSIPTVRYCELMVNPELFSGKVIRLQADYYTNFEWDYLYDLECNGQDNRISPILNCADKQRCQK